MTKKVYNGIVEPTREPDFIFHETIGSHIFSFWFSESIVKYSDTDHTNNWYFICYHFKRVEKKTGPRYQHRTEEFGWTSLTGCWITSYANQVIYEIEQARIRWMATKALEESLK